VPPNCEPDEVREAYISGVGSQIALTFAGYLNFWGHGARCTEAFKNFAGDATRDELFRLKERFSEMHSWRINLRNTNTSDRFEQVQEHIARQLLNETRAEGMDRRGAEIIQESMETAFELWGVRTPVLARKPTSLLAGERLLHFQV
jgi:hypothetical protein